MPLGLLSPGVVISFEQVVDRCYKKTVSKNFSKVATSSTTTPSRSPDSSGVESWCHEKTGLDADLDEWVPEEWEGDQEWDPSWDQEWDPSWEQEWEGEGKACEGDLVTEVPVERKLEFGNKDTAKEKEDEYEESNGLIWDPIHLKEIELGPCNHTYVGEHGLWVAHFEGLDGNLYSFAKINPVNPDFPPPPPTARRGEKISWSPPSKDSLREFTEKAWPKIGEPSGSGLNDHASSSSEPSLREIEIEKRKYPNHPWKLSFLGTELSKELGNKPDKNVENCFSLEIINGMNLKEHMLHSTWYSKAEDFKARIPVGISDQLWGELVEIYKLITVYDCTSPEKVVTYLRAQWADACSN